MPSLASLPLGFAALSPTYTVATNGVVMKVRDTIKLIEDDGWREIWKRGSHRQFKHPTKAGLVTIPGKPGDDLAVGTFNSILKQAGLK